MNRTLTFAMIFATAMPLFAADPKPAAKPAPPAAPVPQVESPLVAAARRANRLGKKPAYVITNDNLVTTGGHFTTTDQQIPFVTPLYPPGGPVVPPAQPQQQSAAQAKAAQEKKAEEERVKVMKQLQMQWEGETLNEDQDPAAIERHQQQMQKQEKKP